MNRTTLAAFPFSVLEHFAAAIDPSEGVNSLCTRCNGKRRSCAVKSGLAEQQSKSMLQPKQVPT